MTFEFNQQLMPQNLIDIDQIGQFAVEGSNEEGYCYYIIVRTLLGVTTIATCGPVVPDIELLPSGFKMDLNRFQYKEEKLGKTINMWLNDRSKSLTEAHEITIDEAIEQFRDLKEYLRNYSEENN